MTVSDRVLYPSVSVPDEVDGDVFPVVIMAFINTKRITSLLKTIPQVPGQLEEVSTTNNFVINGSIRIEWFADSIVMIGGLIGVTIILGTLIKSDDRP